MKHIKLENLQPSKTNPRFDASGDDLVESIRESGLQVPLMVTGEKCPWPEGTIIRGHRRYDAIQKLKSLDFEAFEMHFSKGIPCEVVQGKSEPELVDLQIDHGLTRPLTKAELYLAARNLFAEGFNEGEVSLRLASLLDLHYRVPAKKAAKFSSLKEENYSEYAAAYKDYRRGLVQSLHNVYRLGGIVEEVYIAQNGGPEPKTPHLKGKSLSAATIRKAYSAQKADDSKTESGAPKYGRGRLAPEARKVVEEAFAGNPAKSNKRPSKTQLEEKAKTFSSEGFRVLATWAAGDDVDGQLMRQLDSDYADVDLIRECDKDFLQEIRDAAETLRNEG